MRHKCGTFQQGKAVTIQKFDHLPLSNARYCSINVVAILALTSGGSSEAQMKVKFDSICM